MHFLLPLSKRNFLILICLLSSVFLSACNKEEEIPADFEYLARADSFIAQGQLSSARIELMNAMQINPGNPRTFSLMADLFQSLEIYDRAAQQLEKSASLKKDDSIETRLKIIDLKIRGNDINTFNELQSIDTNSTQQEATKNLLLAKNYFLQKDLKEAKIYYDKVITSLSASENNNDKDLVSEAYLGLAQIAFKESAKNKETIIQLINQSLELNPDFVDALLIKGNLSLAMKKFSEAENSYTEALLALKQLDVMTGKKYIILSGLVEALNRQGKPDQALKYSELLARSRPGRLKSNYESALDALASQNMEKARENFETVLSISPSHPHSNYMVGLMNLQEGDLATAEKHLSLANTGEKIPDKARSALIVTRLRLKQYDQALPLINEGLENSPNNPAYLSLKGSYEMAQNNYPEAEKLFHSALKINEEFLPSISELALLYTKKGNQSQAEAFFKKATDLAPDNIELMLLRVGHAFQFNKVSSLSSELEKLAQQKSELIAPHLALASLYLRENKLSLVDRHVKHAQKINADHPLIKNLISNSRFNQARAEATKGNTEKALQLLDEALDAQAKHIKANVLKAGLLTRQGEIDKALMVTENLKSDSRTRLLGHELEGNIWAQQAQFEKAILAYEQIWPEVKNAKLGLKLYKIKSEVRNFSEASQHIEDWVQEDSNNYEAITMLAVVKNEGGQIKESIALYEKSLEIRPNNPVVLNNLAFAYHSNKDPRALEMALKAYELASSNPAIADTYGWILLENGYIEKALPILAKAADKAPNVKEILQHYSSALAKAGRNEEAAEIMKKITEL